MSDRPVIDDYRRGRRDAYLEVRRLALAGVGSSTTATAETRLLWILAEHCTIAAETDLAGRQP